MYIHVYVRIYIHTYEGKERRQLSRVVPRKPTYIRARTHTNTHTHTQQNQPAATAMRTRRSLDLPVQLKFETQEQFFMLQLTWPLEICGCIAPTDSCAPSSILRLY